MTVYSAKLSELEFSNMFSKSFGLLAGLFYSLASLFHSFLNVGMIRVWHHDDGVDVEISMLALGSDVGA